MVRPQHLELYLLHLALRPQRLLELALAAVNSPHVVVRRRTRCDSGSNAQTISLSSAYSHPREVQALITRLSPLLQLYRPSSARGGYIRGESHFASRKADFENAERRNNWSSCCGNLLTTRQVAHTGNRSMYRFSLRQAGEVEPHSPFPPAIDFAPYCFRLLSNFLNGQHRTTPPEIGVYTSSGGLSKERS